MLTPNVREINAAYWEALPVLPFDHSAQRAMVLASVITEQHRDVYPNRTTPTKNERTA